MVYAWGVRTCSVLHCGVCLGCEDMQRFALWCVKHCCSGSAVEPEATRVAAGERCTQCFQAPGKRQELEERYIRIWFVF